MEGKMIEKNHFGIKFNFNHKKKNKPLEVVEVKPSHYSGEVKVDMSEETKKEIRRIFNMCYSEMNIPHCLCSPNTWKGPINNKVDGGIYD